MIARRKIVFAGAPCGLGLARSMAAGLCLASGLGRAQQNGRRYLIGYFGGSRSAHIAARRIFADKLRALGYVEGVNTVIEERYSEGDSSILAKLAAELLHLRPDVILAANVEHVRALKQLTTTVPIVMAATLDPVGAGLVASLNRPGGNVTGLAFTVGAGLGPRHLQVLKEIMPGLSRVAVLRESGYLPAGGSDELNSAAASLGLALDFVDVRSIDDMERALSEIRSLRVRALLNTAGSIYNVARQRIADFAIAERMLAVGGDPAAGWLFAFGSDLSYNFLRAAEYADKILRGAKPADLPVEQPSRTRMAINLKTANAIGVTIPKSVLLRADEVIR